MVDPNMIERVAAALDGAEIGHSMSLTRLIDGVHTYALRMDGKVEEFVDDEDDEAIHKVHARIREIRLRKQAEAVIAALSPSPGSCAAIHSHTLRKAVRREEESDNPHLAEELREAMRFIERVAEGALPPADAQGWHSHDGMIDPEVSGDTLVEVCFRDGDIAVGVVHDWDQNWQWAHSDEGLTAPGAIVAWRPHYAPRTDVVPRELCDLTFAVQHNPRCPSPWLVRLPGKSGTIDMKPYRDPVGIVKHETTDHLGFGKTLREAARAALASKEPNVESIENG
ncbi:hypothetical protein GOB57_08155 [Sinorhizobium meliloti]|nr:hypothetical protein [Sinorhizobium meliloti]